MIKAGIIGATGYAGSQLMRLLSNHPDVEIKTITARSYIGKAYPEVYENFREITPLVCEEENVEKMAEECDVIFMALPHGLASKLVSESVLSKCKVIDFGADFRLKDLDIYKKWYGVEHFGAEFIDEAVYGLCELNREKIKKARLIANPGCYTTCSILALSPLVKFGLIEEDSIIVDAKSGVSGAGRGVELTNLFCEVNENMKAYKIAAHRHTPEIEEQISYFGKSNIIINFTPHLTPMNRGILATSYAKLVKGVTEEDVRKAYMSFYANEYFVRLTKAGTFPETKWVKGSNFTDIGFKIDERTGRIIVISALDNLIKGAAGQAVQNMNILFGIDEKTGLTTVPDFPV